MSMYLLKSGSPFVEPVAVRRGSVFDSVLKPEKTKNRTKKVIIAYEASTRTLGSVEGDLSLKVFMIRVDEGSCSWSQPT